MLYHLTPEGPKKCSANTPESCHYGGRHFENLDEAYDSIEKEMVSKGMAFTPIKKSKSKASAHIEPTDVKGSLEKVCSTERGLAQVQEVINTRLSMTERYVDAMDMRDPNNPEAEQPVRKNVYSELRKRFNSYRDRTAQLVEAEDNSPHVVRAYHDEDLDRVGLVTTTTSFEPNSREWLEARQDTLGGSDVGVIAVNDFASEDELTYWDRRGLDRVVESKTVALTEESLAKSRKLSLGGSGPLYRGTVWENRIRNDFAKDHPKLQVINTKNQYAREDRPWQQINVDGILSSRSDGKPDGILEIKTSGAPSTWANGVPLSYRAQTLYYLNATGLKYAKVRVLINDTESRDFTLHANDEVAKGSGVTMSQYIDSRLYPWLENARAIRK